MRGLTILLAAAEPSRLHAALSLAAAQAALGGRARLFVHGEAVRLLSAPGEDVERYARAGLPTIAELRVEAAALGVGLTACQSGMMLAGLTHAALGQGVEAGGLTGLLTALDDDRLVVF